MKKRNLHGVKITGNWDDKHNDRRDGKVCQITAPAELHDIKECAKICQAPWFEPAAMRFFKSHVGDETHSDGYGGAYFVSSEKGPYGPRKFSVRHYVSQKCNFRTVGEFQQYSTAAEAKRAMRKLVGKK
jgi:hypothetical protein